MTFEEMGAEIAAAITADCDPDVLHIRLEAIPPTAARACLAALSVWHANAHPRFEAGHVLTTSTIAAAQADGFNGARIIAELFSDDLVIASVWELATAACREWRHL